jgi:hypothetical protein
VSFTVPADAPGPHVVSLVGPKAKPVAAATAQAVEVIVSAAFDVIEASPVEPSPTSERTTSAATPTPTPAPATPAPTPTPTPAPATPAPTPTPTPAPATPAPTPTPTPAPTTAGCPSNLQTAIRNTAAGGTLDIRGCEYRLPDGVDLDRRITLRGGTLIGDGVQRGDTYLLLNVTADGAVVDGTELRNAWRGARVNGTDNVTLRNVRIHHVGRTGLEIQNHSVGVAVVGCRIHDTGLANEGNAEAIYIGSARSSSSWGSPDYTRNGRVAACTIGPNVAEAVDIKDDSYGFVIENNSVTGAEEANSGAINVRGHDHTVRYNSVIDNAGSGIRFGGTPEGVAKNHVVGNVASQNGGYGYKCADGPQLTFVDNSGSGNGSGLMTGSCQ